VGLKIVYSSQPGSRCFAATALWLGGTGMIGRDIVGLFGRMIGAVCSGFHRGVDVPAANDAGSRSINDRQLAAKATLLSIFDNAVEVASSDPAVIASSRRQG